MVCNEDRAKERRTRTIDVRRIRGRLRYTQRQFAGYFGLSLATLRHWERGNRRPAGPALVLLTFVPRAARDGGPLLARRLRKHSTITPLYFRFG